MNACEQIRAEFSGYLDGAVSGVAMAAISSHLELCRGCADEFVAWRNVQSALGQVGPAHPPARLESQLRTALAAERELGMHLSPLRWLAAAWQRTLAPLALRASVAVALAVLLLGGLGTIFATPIAVQANDDGLADLRGPHYLYSQVPPQPIETRSHGSIDVPIVVEARVDASGRVYDYSILEGPSDEHVRLQVEQNLLASVFRPASVFGAAVPGHVLVTFTGVSVHE